MKRWHATRLRRTANAQSRLASPARRQLKSRSKQRTHTRLGSVGGALTGLRGATRRLLNSIGHYTKHIAPSIGDKAFKHWTPTNVRKLCRDLDRKVQAGTIAWKTAFNIWGNATRMCDDASESKVEVLRVRDDNPADGVRGPDSGAEKGKQSLSVRGDGLHCASRGAVALAPVGRVRVLRVNARRGAPRPHVGGHRP